MKKQTLFLALLAIGLLTATTFFGCSKEEEDWAEDEYSTLANMKMTRSGEDGTINTLVHINDTTIYHYDIEMMDSDTIAYTAWISVRFDQDKEDLDVDLVTYQCYDGNLECTVNQVWMRKERYGSNWYFLCGSGYNQYGKVCTGEVKGIVFFE